MNKFNTLNNFEKNGLFLLDKPSGITSNQALQKVKRLLKIKKAGHTGSLDPLATGVLPICIGEATKFAQYLLDDTKHYEVVLELGKETDSGDIEGKIVKFSQWNQVTEEAINISLEEFKGEIFQVPPMFSALKYQGQPLYRLARKGIEVPREARKIQIYSLQLKKFQENKVILTVHCSKGTYIRSLALDLGKVWGCGATVIALRRTKVANFSLDDCVSLEELDKINMLNLSQEHGLKFYPVSKLVQNLPALTLTDAQIKVLYFGQIFDYPLILSNTDYGVYDSQQNFLGVASGISNNQLKAKRLIQRA